jgi:hypothetical protein
MPVEGVGWRVGHPTPNGDAVGIATSPAILAERVTRTLEWRAAETTEAESRGLREWASGPPDAAGSCALPIEARPPGGGVKAKQPEGGFQASTTSVLVLCVRAAR